jgi:hypothetical protein
MRSFSFRLLLINVQSSVYCLIIRAANVLHPPFVAELERCVLFRFAAHPPFLRSSVGWSNSGPADASTHVRLPTCQHYWLPQYSADIPPSSVNGLPRSAGPIDCADLRILRAISEW